MLKVAYACRATYTEDAYLECCLTSFETMMGKGRLSFLVYQPFYPVIVGQVFSQTQVRYQVRELNKMSSSSPVHALVVR